MVARFGTSARDGIVTPEAVLLEFDTAGLASRLLAAFLDAAIQLLVLLGVLLGVYGLSELGLDLGGLGTAFLYVLVFLLLFGYPAAFETLWRGRTPGKAALGLRVVTVEGGPIRFRHAAIRAMLGIFDKYLFTGMVGVLSVLATRRNQRLGDLVGGTIVLRERSGAKAPSAVRFAAPHGLEGYVASLDVGRLGHEDYGTIRSFLLRAPSLSPAARQHVAGQLAASTVTRLHAVPPPGLPPEVFLVCVAAAHQHRNAPAAMPAPFESVWAAPSSKGFARPPSAAPPARSHTGFTAPS
ncbi:MAG TPA: RDD family protein [Acidimicrobiales bacterium]|nr:RDD family protein [Acidimicrobiales bacterium]